jgi:hypothetical protein
MTVKFGSVTLLAVGSLLWFGACQSLRPSRTALTAPIRTDSVQIGVRHRGFTYRADIGFVFTNTTPNPVSTSSWCPPFQILEKKVLDHWVAATNFKNCLASGTTYALTIESGKSYRDDLQFWASDRGHSGWPELMLDSIEGTFRLRWDFVEGKDVYAKGARKVEGISNEFQMVLSKE